MTTTSSRLLALLSLLQARRDWSGDVLAQRLDVTTRTVRRDVDRLRELGYQIAAFKGPDGGYRLDAGADLPPLLFDDDQAVALAVSLQLGATAGAGIGEAALRALTTLRQVLPSRLRHRLDALAFDSVRAPGTSETEVDSAVLLTLAGTVRSQEVLRFDYGTSADDAAPPRRVEPHHVVTWHGRWYLVAWDLERADWRTFRADRIRPRIPHGPRFAHREVPGGDVATFVTGQFRGNEGSTAWPCQGEAIIDRPVAEVAPFIGDGVAEPMSHDRTRVTLGSWSWPALVASFLRFDADIEVVGPDALAVAMREAADRCQRAASTSRGRTAPGP
ncbi:helix-turn-helix transcriptional regulator [Nocardioides sp. Root190]|uniref:helix-turn-helix transcriptional regulator n=1 Tax=Nocardioides sp. Root190 TaxID=1736488 RepID=UPI0009EBA231|nr:YafY family protein [Nocardioides sp. Root190]